MPIKPTSLSSDSRTPPSSDNVTSSLPASTITSATTSRPMTPTSASVNTMAHSCLAAQGTLGQSPSLTEKSITPLSEEATSSPSLPFPNRQEAITEAKKSVHELFFPSFYDPTSSPQERAQYILKNFPPNALFDDVFLQTLSIELKTTASNSPESSKRKCALALAILESPEVLAPKTKAQQQGSGSPLVVKMMRDHIADALFETSDCFYLLPDPLKNDHQFAIEALRGGLKWEGLPSVLRDDLGFQALAREWGIPEVL